MNEKNKPFEHEIDPLICWQKSRNGKRLTMTNQREYYPNPDLYQTAAFAARSSPAQLLL